MRDDATVTVVGSVNLDTTLLVPRIPVAGETVLSPSRSTSPGGKGANQAAAAAAAGAQVQFIASIGDDEHGVIAVENLRAWDVDLSALQVFDDVPSGEAYVVLAESDAENLIIVSPGANSRLDPHEVARILESTDHAVLLTQLETPLDVLRACAASSSAAWRILNPAPVAATTQLLPLLDSFNVLVPNRAELGLLVGNDEPRSLDSVREYVAKLSFNGAVVVTLGAAGAALFLDCEASPLLIPPPTVQPVNTTGAGDVFCGYLAHELASHGDLEQAVGAAVCASALSTEVPHAQLQAHLSEVTA